MSHAAEFFDANAFTVDYVSPFPRETIGDYSPSGYPAGLPRRRHIRMEGMIEQGDAVKLRPLLRGADQFGNIVLSMNSPGGNFEAAIELGDLIAESSVMTLVGPGDECLSACAFAFLAGQQTVLRGALSEPTRVLHVGGKLGLHAPSLPGRVPSALLEKNSSVLMADIAKPTRKNIQDLQHRSGPWSISSSLLFEILGRAGANELFYIDRWHEAYENRILVVDDTIRPPPHVGMIEAVQGCSLLIGTLLWDANPTASMPYYTGKRDDWIPGAEFFRYSGLAHEFDVLVTETVGKQSFRFTQVIPGRGNVICEVRHVEGTWFAKASGDLPTNSQMAYFLETHEGLPLNALTALGFGVPWSTVGASDLYVREADLLWKDVPSDVLASAESIDFCATNRKETWSVVCRYPILHRSLAVLVALIEASRSAHPEVVELYAKWSSEIDRLCRPSEPGVEVAISEMMGGYCGLSVTHDLIWDPVRPWSTN